MRFTLYRPALALFLALAAGLPPLPAQAAPAATAQAPDYAALIGDFPPPGSDGAKADQAILLWLQRTRTHDEVLRAESEVLPHLGLFSEAVGTDLETGPFPLTRALAYQAQRDLREATSALKDHFARPRPYNAMPSLTPAIPGEPTFSYPSGHASWGMVEATLLARLLPQRREAILARGRQVGYDRVLGGVHYPSDVDAGQRLGPVFVDAWLAVPGNRLRLEQVRAAEWSSLQ